ncbi:MAG: class I SAM-dependent methyltransferase [Burkholderiaceae bacterium]|nr:class I SAM-dependent methyltransferase [Burkholderiaceae bacterium]
MTKNFLWQDRDKKNYPYPCAPRPECLAMIQRPPVAALDIGCGSGGVGRALRQRFPDCQLWGCEFDGAAAQQARKYFDHVIEQDVESVDFAALGLKQPFDLVCLFDVLEHLFNPWQLLHNLLPRIAGDAHLLVSLPNVGNIALLHDALRGHWKYLHAGLLDFTHLRFFTDFDARKMFYQTGYRVLDHRMSLLGQSTAIYNRHADGPFPAALTFGGITLQVESQAHWQRLCADQNLYLITPHHGQLANQEEREMASNHYPPVHAFDGSLLTRSLRALHGGL